MARIRSIFLNSGQKTSKKTNSLYALCHIKKPLILFSPDVLKIISADGWGRCEVYKFSLITCTKCNLEMSYGEYVRYVAHSDSTYSDILGDYAGSTKGQTAGSLDEWD